MENISYFITEEEFCLLLASRGLTSIYAPLSGDMPYDEGDGRRRISEAFIGLYQKGHIEKQMDGAVV